LIQGVTVCQVSGRRLGSAYHAEPDLLRSFHHCIQGQLQRELCSIASTGLLSPVIQQWAAIDPEASWLQDVVYHLHPILDKALWEIKDPSPRGVGTWISIAMAWWPIECASSYAIGCRRGASGGELCVAHNNCVHRGCDLSVSQSALPIESRPS
jgi:hypothetical protein